MGSCRRRAMVQRGPLRGSCRRRTLARRGPQDAPWPRRARRRPSRGAAVASLRCAPPGCHLSAVSQDGRALRPAAQEPRSDREAGHAAVLKDLAHRSRQPRWCGPAWRSTRGGQPGAAATPAQRVSNTISITRLSEQAAPELAGSPPQPPPGPSAAEEERACREAVLSAAGQDSHAQRRAFEERRADRESPTSGCQDGHALRPAADELHASPGTISRQPG